MKYLKEEGKLIDFLISLTMVETSQKFFEGNFEGDTIFREIAGEAYLKVVEAYIKDISPLTTIPKFVSVDNNFLMKLATREKAFFYEDFCKALQDLKKEDFERLIIRTVYDKDEKEREKAALEIRDLERLEMSEAQKRGLLMVLEDFPAYREKLLSELDQAREAYKKARGLLDPLLEEDQKAGEILEDDGLYEKILKNYISYETYKKIDFLILLPLSFYYVYVQTDDEYEMSAVFLGYHIPDIYQARQAKKKLEDLELAKVFKILSDPTRYGILKLIEEGVTSNSVLADKFGVTPAAISYQFKYLTENGIISKDEKTKKIEVNKDLVKSAIEVLKIDLNL